MSSDKYHMAQATYKGVRNDLDITKPLALYDADAVYDDLFSIFNTLPYSPGRRAGQRVRMPNFGSYLKLYLYEPNTIVLQQKVREEVRRIIDLDPRVTATSINVRASDNSVTVDVLAYLVSIGVEKLMSFQFLRL